jgi:ribosomal 50S subunit-recycling heat shock protein
VRLDLYLKTSRLLKRRAVARQMCDNSRVLVNGHKAKPAKEVRPGDVVTLKWASRIIDIEVLGVVTISSKKKAPEELYRVKAVTRLPKEKDQWIEDLS